MEEAISSDDVADVCAEWGTQGNRQSVLMEDVNSLVNGYASPSAREDNQMGDR